MHRSFTHRNASYNRLLPWLTKASMLLLLILSQAGVLSAHTVDYFSSCGYVCAGSTVTVNAHLSATASNTNYNWQFRDNSGAWKCFVNGSNTINGVAFSVSNATARGQLSAAPTLTIANATTALSNVDVRIVMADGTTSVSPCASNPSYPVYGTDKSLKLHVLTGSDCSNIAAYCSGGTPGLKLGDLIWNDINGNGVKDADEPGVANATVKLYTDSKNDNTADGAAIATTTTNASGVYTFSNLKAGNYIVGVIIPTGYTKGPASTIDPDNNVNNDNNGVYLIGTNEAGSEVRSKAITLSSSGEPTTDGDDAYSNLTLDIALCGNSELGDFVWNDKNANGIQDLSEPGIQGVTVKLLFPDGVTTRTTTTDANGKYFFTALAPGSYKVTFTTPSTFTASPVNQGGNDAKDSDPVSGSVTVAVTAGTSNLTIDAGFYQKTLPPPPPTSNGEQCFVSPTIPNIANAKSVWTINSDGTVTIRTTFAKTFVDNTYGTNSIGWGTKGHKFADLTGSDHLQLALYDASGTKKTEFSLDYITASSTAPSGYTTLGVNGGDGKMISGNASDIVSVKTSLSEDFNTYGYVLTTNSPATDANYTPNASAPNWIYDVWYEVTVKQSVFGSAGFGYPRISEVHASPSKTGNNSETVEPGPCPQPPANLTLGNQVWNDFDGDGKRDDNEPGIPGATISLYTDNDGDNLPDGPAIKTTTSDALGHYQFTNLTEGRYIASMPILPGYQQSPNTTTQETSPFPDNNVDNDNNLVRLVGPNGPGGVVYTNAITLTANEEPTDDGDDANGNNTFDLAECGNSFIGDFVWNDYNGNGIQDAGEPGINGVPVTITFSDGRTATTTTSTYNAPNNLNVPQFDGYYNFPNLGPGTYKISFATPDGLHASPANAGDDAKDSDPVNGGPVTVVLAADQSNFTIDAGFTAFIAPPPPVTTCPNLSVGNMVFNDANGNGVKDATEQGIGGLTVKLYADNDGNNVADGAAIATLMTADDGTYYFGNLAAGKYIVGVTTGSTYVQTTFADATPDDNKDNDNNGVKTVNGEVFSNAITLSAGDEPINDGSDNNSNLTLDFGLKIAPAPCTNHCECHNDCTHTGCGHPNCGHNSCKNDCKHTGCGHPNCGHNSCKNDCNHTGCGHPNCGHNSCKNNCTHTGCGHSYCGRNGRRTSDNTTTVVSVYPNPTTSYFQLKVDAVKSGIGQVRITDGAGHIVATKNVTISLGSNNITFSDLSELKSGRYNVQLLFGYHVYNQQLLLIK